MTLTGMCIIRFAMCDTRTIQKKYENSKSQINAAVIEFIQAMPLVRTFDDGTTSFKRYLSALYRYRKIYTQWMKKSGTPSRIAFVLLWYPCPQYWQ